MERTVETSNQARDFRLPEACVACGGDLAVRVGPGSAWSACLSCHRLAPVRMGEVDGEFAMLHPPGALA
ncbi:MAG TPA: hypothetical protein VFE30_00495 [Anaeromyxobacteraceae bacterium]|jgi:hypothetical protein|nr:hypothetical protein [Anaeromyxobacteraceae bacterium]